MSRANLLRHLQLLWQCPIAPASPGPNFLFVPRIRIRQWQGKVIYLIKVEIAALEVMAQLNY